MKRLDAYLAENGHFPSRAKAKQAIESGGVRVDGKTADRPSSPVYDNSVVEVAQSDGYVSRGAYKLLKALDHFAIDMRGACCIDVGASTGGFTQVLLRRGAAAVVAVDVGKGQLAAELREDSRVVPLEETDIRTLRPSDLPFVPSFAAIDVSFISLSLVLPHIKILLAEGGEAVALVKPQFEAGRGAVGKSGVLKDKKVHADVLEKFALAAESTGLLVVNLTHSPIRGGDGNVEYLAHLKKYGRAAGFDVREFVRVAFESSFK